MNAIELLSEQHRQVEKLFESIEKAEGEAKMDLLRDLQNALAAHATIEEKIFYPRTMAARTEDMLREAVHEHLSAKRVIADMLAKDDIEDDDLDAQIKVLKDQIEHHVEEEEGELFPEVKKLFAAELDEMGAEMEAMFAELMQGEPREAVPGETAEPAPLE